MEQLNKYLIFSRSDLARILPQDMTYEIEKIYFQFLKEWEIDRIIDPVINNFMMDSMMYNNEEDEDEREDLDFSLFLLFIQKRKYGTTEPLSNDNVKILINKLMSRGFNLVDMSEFYPTFMILLSALHLRGLDDLAFELIKYKDDSVWFGRYGEYLDGENAGDYLFSEEISEVKSSLEFFKDHILN